MIFALPDLHILRRQCFGVPFRMNRSHWKVVCFTVDSNKRNQHVLHNGPKFESERRECATSFNNANLCREKPGCDRNCLHRKTCWKRLRFWGGIEWHRALNDHDISMSDDPD
jgi:hypothetical protein